MQPEPRTDPGRKPHDPPSTDSNASRLIRHVDSGMLVQSESAILPTDERLIHNLMHLEMYEEKVQASWRERMYRDHRFADGHQYDPETLAALRARGQPIVTYNWIHPRILWMTGTERRNRVDFNIGARDEDPQANEIATIKKQLLKYISDVNYDPHARSTAAKEAFISGLSWLESGIRHDPDEEPIYTRHETWANVLQDSTTTDPLGRDMRYLIRQRNLDTDVAEAYWPKFADALRNAAYNYSERNAIEQFYLGRDLAETAPEWYELQSAHLGTDFAWAANPRTRVKVRETWHFIPHKQRGVSKGGSTIERVKMKLMLFIWANDVLLAKAPSPYNHNVIPFVPVRCFTEFDGCPKGVVRDMISPSEAFNKKQSKAVFASNSKTILMETTALDEHKMNQRQLEENAAKPNAILIFADGALSGNRVKLETAGALAQANVDLARIDYDYINQGSGINSENLGNQTNATSGIAIQGRQQEGQVTITEPFDNVHLAYHRHGELQLSLLEQFYLAPRTVPMHSAMGKPDFLHVNSFDPDTGEYQNDLTKFTSQFILSEQAWKASLAQNSMESLWGLLREIAAVDPTIVSLALDMLIQYGDLPTRAKDVLIKRIRDAKGLEDPDNKDDPEQLAKKQAQEQQAQEDAQRQRAAIDAKTAESQSKAAETQAKTSHWQARTEKERADLAKSLMETVANAINTALAADAAMPVTEVADSLLQAVNFPDQTPATPGIL